MPKFSIGFMVAGGMSANGVGKLIFCIGTLDSYAYSQCLVHYKNDIDYLSSEERLYFQQDNASSHSSLESSKNLQYLKRLEFYPANSPDLSPISPSQN